MKARSLQTVAPTPQAATSCTCATPSTCSGLISPQAISATVSTPSEGRGRRLGLLGVLQSRRQSACQPLRENRAERPVIAKLAISVLAALRGSICLYQGEELGLPEAELAFEDLRDPYGIRFWPAFKGRDGCRTPMPWEAAKAHAGFTTAAKSWLPCPMSRRPFPWIPRRR
jgi:hypothetical protein